MSGTRFNKPITIGATQTVLASLGAAVMLFVAGQLQVQDAVNFVPDGTTTGAVLAINGISRFQPMTPKACTATGGGVGNYPTCSYVSPFTSSGILLGFTAECGNVGRSLTGDFSLKAGLKTGSGIPLTNGNNVTLGTGVVVASMLAQPIGWPATQVFAFSTNTDFNTTETIDCMTAPIVIDKYGD